MVVRCEGVEVQIHGIAKGPVSDLAQRLAIDEEAVTQSWQCTNGQLFPLLNPGFALS